MTFVLLACGNASEVTRDDGGSAPPSSEAGVDASEPAPVGMDAATDAEAPWWMRVDGSLDFGGLTGQRCLLRVAAQCDGPEDCAQGACCARFEPSAVSYTAIECAEQCDYVETFPLCHAGQTCAADGRTVCRTSLLIPDDFIGVCAPRNDLARTPTGEAIAGEIDCGAERCEVGVEQCCLREAFDLDLFQSVSFEPYCAPIGAVCDCGPPRRADGGTSLDDGGL